MLCYALGICYARIRVLNYVNNYEQNLNACVMGTSCQVINRYCAAITASYRTAYEYEYTNTIPHCKRIHNR